jgi:hypothetical protein
VGTWNSFLAPFDSFVSPFRRLWKDNEEEAEKGIPGSVLNAQAPSPASDFIAPVPHALLFDPVSLDPAVADVSAADCLFNRTDMYTDGEIPTTNTSFRDLAVRVATRASSRFARGWKRAVRLGSQLGAWTVSMLSSSVAVPTVSNLVWCMWILIALAHTSTLLLLPILVSTVVPCLENLLPIGAILAACTEAQPVYLSPWLLPLLGPTNDPSTWAAGSAILKLAVPFYLRRPSASTSILNKDNLVFLGTLALLHEFWIWWYPFDPVHGALRVRGWVLLLSTVGVRGIMGFWSARTCIVTLLIECLFCWIGSRERVSASVACTYVVWGFLLHRIPVAPNLRMEVAIAFVRWKRKSNAGLDAICSGIARLLDAHRAIMRSYAGAPPLVSSPEHHCPPWVAAAKRYVTAEFIWPGWDSDVFRGVVWKDTDQGIQKVLPFPMWTGYATRQEERVAVFSNVLPARRSLRHPPCPEKSSLVFRSASGTVYAFRGDPHVSIWANYFLDMSVLEDARGRSQFLTLLQDVVDNDSSSPGIEPLLSEFPDPYRGELSPHQIVAFEPASGPYVPLWPPGDVVQNIGSLQERAKNMCDVHETQNKEERHLDEKHVEKKTMSAAPGTDTDTNTDTNTGVPCAAVPSTDRDTDVPCAAVPELGLQEAKEKREQDTNTMELQEQGQDEKENDTKTVRSFQHLLLLYIDQTAAKDPSSLRLWNAMEGRTLNESIREGARFAMSLADWLANVSCPETERDSRMALLRLLRRTGETNLPSDREIVYAPDSKQEQEQEQEQEIVADEPLASVASPSSSSEPVWTYADEKADTVHATTNETEIEPENEAENEIDTSEEIPLFTRKRKIKAAPTGKKKTNKKKKAEEKEKEKEKESERNMETIVSESTALAEPDENEVDLDAIEIAIPTPAAVSVGHDVQSMMMVAEEQLMDTHAPRHSEAQMLHLLNEMNGLLPLLSTLQLQLQFGSMDEMHAHTNPNSNPNPNPDTFPRPAASSSEPNEPAPVVVVTDQEQEQEREQEQEQDQKQDAEPSTAVYEQDKQ